MPKTSGIPKSILADINKLKTRLTSLEKNHNSLIKDFKSAIKSHSEMLKKQQPEREDDARNEHDRRRQSLEGKRQHGIIDGLFNATDRPRLAITDTTVLTIPASSGGLMRGCTRALYRPTHFLEYGSIGVIRDIKA